MRAAFARSTGIRRRGGAGPVAAPVPNPSASNVIFLYDFANVIGSAKDESQWNYSLSNTGAAVDSTNTLFGKNTTAFTTGDDVEHLAASTQRDAMEFVAGDFVAEAWVYISGTISAGMAIASVYNLSTGQRNWIFRIDNDAASNVLRMHIYPNAGSSSGSITVTGPSVPKGQFVHCVIQREGNDHTIFVDGVPGTTLTSTVRPSGGGTLQVLWGDTASGGNQFVGSIGEARITDNEAFYPVAGFSKLTASYPRPWWVTSYATDSGVNPALALDYTAIAGGRYMADSVADTFSGLHTFTRASTATYRDSSGIIQTAASGVERFDHDKDGNRIGLLIEEARTNIALQSNAFDATWLATRNDLTGAKITSPDGTANGWSFKDNAAGSANDVVLSQNVTVSTATAYTYSIFAKQDQLSWIALRSAFFTTPGNAITYFDLANGVLGSTGVGHSSSIEDYGNGWYRCIVTFTTDATDTTGTLDIMMSDGNADIIVDLDGTSSVYIYGAQFEAGPTASTYIPTTTVSVTRAVETCSIAAVNWSFDNSATSKGSFLTAYRKRNFTERSAVFGLVSTGNAAIHIENAAATAESKAFIRDNSSAIDTLVGATGLAVATKHKAAISYANNDTAISVNGATVVTGANCGENRSTLTGELIIGAAGNGGIILNDHIEALVYYLPDLSNSDVEGVST